MTHRRLALNALGWTLVMGLFVAAPTATVNDQEATRSLALASSRVSIAGTSNFHAFTASTSTVRVTRFQFATGANPTDWEEILKPGAIEALEFVIPVQTLKSEKDGLDKNMHKALKASEHPNITFRLSRMEPDAAAGRLRATGILRIAGVDRQIALDLTTERKDTNLCVHGQVQMLMTDFGIEPPKAMLGMLKTDPKVTVTFETVLAIPLM